MEPENEPQGKEIPLGHRHVFMIIFRGLDPNNFTREVSKAFLNLQFFWVPICQSRRLIRQSKDLSFRNMLDMFGKKELREQTKQSKTQYPNAQCMVYLPTFTINLGQM